MKIKFTREIVVAYEIVGYFLIMIGLSFHVPYLLFFLFDYFSYLTSLLPGTWPFPEPANVVNKKPDFPNLPSLWVAVPCVIAGIAFIVFARMVRKTFKTE